MMDSTTKVVVVEEGKPTPSGETSELEWYTPNERCDSCVSQSYFMVVFSSGNLFFCKHHFDKNEAFIFETALDVVDESELLKS
jgi:hypothetical protein